MHWNIRGAIAAIGFVAATICLASPASAQTPSLIGRWSAMIDGPYNAFVDYFEFLPNGTVKWQEYNGYNFGNGTPSAQKTGRYRFANGTLVCTFTGGQQQQAQIKFTDSISFTYNSANMRTLYYYRVQ
jgi:hypothetical protein